MSNVTTPKYKQGPGYRLYQELLSASTCNYVFNNVSIEVLFYVFDGVLSREAISNLINMYGLQSTRLICDSKLRRELAKNMGVDLGLESKVLKTSGKTSLYTSAYIRDYIKRNQSIFDAVASVYGSRKLAFTKGLEHFLYKPYMSEESVPILDCKILENLEDMDGLSNPFHYTCLVCMSSPIATSETKDEFQDDASLSLLENFDSHYSVLQGLISPSGKFPISKQKKKIGALSLLENLNIKGLNAELLRLHNANLNNASGKPAGTFKPLSWKNITMRAGDAIIFDCRIPYMTFRNRFDVPAMYVPVSLRKIPKGWYGSVAHTGLVESVKTGKVGDWNKRKVKGCNIDEYSFRTSVQPKNDATKEDKITSWTAAIQSIKTCTDLESFTDHDKRIFGLLQY